MLEDIRKEIEDTIERFKRYDNDGLALQPIEKKYLAHVVPMLSLIDKYKEALEEIAYSGPIEDFKDIAKLALKD